MKSYSYLLIFSLFLVGFVSVGQDLIPFENKGLGLWGFRSQDTGDIVIETKYDEVGGFNQGISSVRIGQLWGFIDQKGKIVIQPKFDSVDNFTDGVSQVWVRNSHGVFLMNKKGKISVSLIYDDGVVSTGGLFPVRKKKKWGGIDKTGKEIIPFIYDNFYRYEFSEGLCGVEKDGKWGFIDKTGKEVVPFIYDDVNWFGEGLSEVKKDGKYGFINKTGEVVIPFIYKGMRRINYDLDLIGVKKDGNGGL